MSEEYQALRRLRDREEFYADIRSYMNAIAERDEEIIKQNVEITKFDTIISNFRRK